LTPLINSLEEKLGSTSFLAVMIQTYFAPLMLLIFNFGIIPVLIDLVAYLEQQKTKSKKQIGIMRKNFFF
jgi:hypothetical protein